MQELKKFIQDEIRNLRENYAHSYTQTKMMNCYSKVLSKIEELGLDKPTKTENIAHINSSKWQEIPLYPEKVTQSIYDKLQKKLMGQDVISAALDDIIMMGSHSISQDSENRYSENRLCAAVFYDVNLNSTFYVQYKIYCVGMVYEVEILRNTLKIIN